MSQPYDTTSPTDTERTMTPKPSLATEFEVEIKVEEDSPSPLLKKPSPDLDLMSQPPSPKPAVEAIVSAPESDVKPADEIDEPIRRAAEESTHDDDDDGWGRYADGSSIDDNDNVEAEPTENHTPPPPPAPTPRYSLRPRSANTQLAPPEPAAPTPIQVDNLVKAIENESGAWLDWGTAEDRCRLEGVLKGLGGEETKWLMLRLVVIEPGLLDDLTRGFSPAMFQRLPPYDSTLPLGFVDGDDEIAIIGRPVWWTRMTISLPRDQWLLALARLNDIAVPAQKDFLLSIGVAYFAYGQYILHFVTELEWGRTKYASLGDLTLEERAQKNRLVCSYPDNPVQRRMTDGHRWGLDWSVWAIDADPEKWKWMMSEIQTTKVGVLANRPWTITPPSAICKSDKSAAQLLMFELEISVLSLLDHLQQSALLGEGSGVIRLARLVRLGLALAKAPSPTRYIIKTILQRVKRAVKLSQDGLSDGEKGELARDPNYEWDMM